MANNAKLPKDFKMFQIRVLDVCPICNGSGRGTYLQKVSSDGLRHCPSCNGARVVPTVLHEGATLDILLAKVFEDAGKHRINELMESES